MCLPTKSDTSSNATSARSVMGLGALLLLACLGGPVHAGALVALSLCLAPPAAAVAWRHGIARRQSRIQL